MTANAAAMWLNTVFAGFDMASTNLVHGLYDKAGWLFTPLSEIVSIIGSPKYMILIILALMLLLFKKTRRFGTAMCLSIAIGAIITNGFLKIVIARPRPYADETSVYYQLWDLMGRHFESDKSFPSGHTCEAFAAMTAVFLTGRKKISWTAYIFAFLTAVARIYLVVHYTTDVIAGLIVGILAGIAGTAIARRLPGGWYTGWDFPPKIGGVRRQKGGKHLC